jgi:hypothetical protein
MAEEIVHGMRELARAMRDWPEKLQRQAMTPVLRRGGVVVRDIARIKVRKVSGRLARSIRVTIVRRGGWLTARVIAGRNKKKDDPFYALMVELGTKPHEIRPKGAKSLFLAGLFREVVQHPGAHAEPFLGPALEEGAAAALDAMQDELAWQVTRYGWFS